MLVVRRDYDVVDRQISGLRSVDINMKRRMEVDLEDLQVFSADGRLPLAELYHKYLILEREHGWIREAITFFKIETDRGLIKVPSLCFRTPQSGSALWVLSGVHGEEPAGPNALSGSIDNLVSFGRRIPMVVMPLLNPFGYTKDWRYFNEHRDWRKGQSVSDSEHYLPDLKDPAKPRALQPASAVAGEVTKFILEKIRDYPPVLTVDHHEDEALANSYIYSQSFRGADDPAAKEAVSILLKSGIPLQLEGATRFGEQVKNGVVVDEKGQPVRDGSVDELFAAKKVFVDGQWMGKPSSRTSLVIETPIINVDLPDRVKAHANIIENYEKLWSLAQE